MKDFSLIEVICIVFVFFCLFFILFTLKNNPIHNCVNPNLCVEEYDG
jgi:hypothetical protein